MVLSLLRALCPYPTVDNAHDFRAGVQLPVPRICQKCKSKGCWQSVTSSDDAISHHVCAKGLSLVLYRFAAGDVLCCGILVKQKNSVCLPEIRKQLQDHKVAWEDMERWHRAVGAAEALFNAEVDRQAQEAIKSLHDVKTAVSLVTRNTEAIVEHLPGRTDDEKIENADPAMKSLIKSVQLLHTRLSMSSIASNPEAACFGRKHATPIYRVFHRMVRLFEQAAARRQVTIRMTGSSFHAPMCYDSFDTVALVLIDNAIKYSLTGKSVSVSVYDSLHDTVCVEVQSFGPVVPVALRKTIFQPGIRAPGAVRFASTGSGLGLHIASIVAAAHGFQIRYRCSDESPSGTEGMNTFSFELSAR